MKHIIILGFAWLLLCPFAKAATPTDQTITLASLVERLKDKLQEDGTKEILDIQLNEAAGELTVFKKGTKSITKLGLIKSVTAKPLGDNFYVEWKSDSTRCITMLNDGKSAYYANSYPMDFYHLEIVNDAASILFTIAKKYSLMPADIELKTYPSDVPVPAYMIGIIDSDAVTMIPAIDADSASMEYFCKQLNTILKSGKENAFKSITGKKLDDYDTKDEVTVKLTAVMKCYLEGKNAKRTYTARITDSKMIDVLNTSIENYRKQIKKCLPDWKETDMQKDGKLRFDYSGGDLKTPTIKLAVEKEKSNYVLFLHITVQ